MKLLTVSLKVGLSKWEFSLDLLKAGFQTAVPASVSVKMQPPTHENDYESVDQKEHGEGQCALRPCKIMWETPGSQEQQAEGGSTFPAEVVSAG